MVWIQTWSNGTKCSSSDIIQFCHEVAKALSMIGKATQLCKWGQLASSLWIIWFLYESTPMSWSSILAEPNTHWSSVVKEVGPTEAIKNESVAHWPIIRSIQRCKLAGYNMRRVFLCHKYNVHLCITGKRYYFCAYHNIM